MRGLYLFIVFNLVACSAHHSHTNVLPNANELQIISAAINHEVASSDVITRRPILVLDRTEKWISVDDPYGISSPKAKGLRQSNKKSYYLSGVTLQEKVNLYSYSAFQKDYDGTAASKKLIKQFGKEPFALSLSRPVFVSEKNAILLLHRQSTWLACGGTDVVHLS